MHYDDVRSKVRLGSVMPAPLFILAPPRSFSSVICTMIGQHPQMYGLPELQLFCAETVLEWRDVCRRSSFPMADGLLRAIGEVFFGEQTDDSIAQAAEWLRQRSHFTTGLVLEEIIKALDPLILVEKSPGLVFRLDFLKRKHRMFPQARYIHLVRHPRSQAEAVMRILGPREKWSTLPSWLIDLGTFPHLSGEGVPRSHVADLDPQRAWYHCHTTILRFLRRIRPEHQLFLRGEDVLSNPRPALEQIAIWMNLSTAPCAIDQMLHPERSSFAHYGPPRARLGNDEFFLQDPLLKTERASACSLEGALSWRDDGRGFFPLVKQLAVYFGYH